MNERCRGGYGVFSMDMVFGNVVASVVCHSSKRGGDFVYQEIKSLAFLLNNDHSRLCP